MKILIAENDHASGRFLSELLGKYGICDLVIDGQESINAFLVALEEREPYDLLCLDIMMPKVDGITTLKTIRDIERQYRIKPDNRIKIIIITALDDARLEQRAFDNGCDEYLTKPIDIERLLKIVDNPGGSR